VIETLAANQTQLQDLLANQRARYPSRSPELGVVSSNVTQTFRTPIPLPVIVMQLVFHLQPRRFPSDQGKIPYVIAKFRGTPLNAIRPYLAPEEGDQPEWLEFDYLERNYGDPDDVERRLLSLTQRGSASAFLAEFQQNLATPIRRCSVGVHPRPWSQGRDS